MKQTVPAGKDGLTKLFTMFEDATDSDRMLAFVRAGWERLRWQSPAKDMEQRDAIAATMRDIGMTELWTGKTPSDGSTAIGGWVMPCRYEVRSGRIEVVDGTCRGLVLFDYEKNPTALMPRSGGTDGEVTVELVLVEHDPDYDVQGKAVLLARPGLEIVRECFRLGAVGVISDFKPYRKGVQEGPILDDATAWLNYEMPPWQEERGFGVTMTPSDGRRVREALAQGRVKVRANIWAELVDTHVPVVTAVWPEGRAEEIVITGHSDEIGADDNLSGIAASLELVRVYRELVENGELEEPARGIRLLFGPEVYGLQSYLSNDDLPWRRFRVGLNIDTVGSNQEAVNACLMHGETFPTAPHCADTLLAEILANVRRRDPLFRHRSTHVDYIDNGISDPEIGAPTPQMYHSTLHHHTSLDRPEELDPGMLRRAVGIAGSYAAVWAYPDSGWADWLARRASAQATDEITSSAADGNAAAPNRVQRLLLKHRRRIATTSSLVPRSEMPRYVREYGSSKEASDRLSADAWTNHVRLVATLDDNLKRAAEIQLQDTALCVPDRTCDSRASDMGSLETTAYRKLFRGLVCTESLHGEVHEKLRQLGYRPYWGAPMWLVMACFMCDGKHTVAEVWRDLARIGQEVNPQHLDAVLAVLCEGALLEALPVLDRDDILRALRNIGIEEGDLVIAHTSLSRFGCIRGGADTMIGALREAVGADGTLVLPTFSFSFIGKGCFDPYSSPAVVGSVPERFRKLPDVLRSLHPSHSFGAVGPLAEDLLRGHDETVPALAQEGPAGRLVEWDAKLVMLAPLATATLMHAAEYWAGYPYQDTYCCLLRSDGTEEVVAVPEAPLHSNFEPGYDILRREKKLRSATLGSNTIYAVGAGEAIDAMTKAFKANPLLPTREGCECLHCRCGRKKYSQ